MKKYLFAIIVGMAMLLGIAALSGYLYVRYSSTHLDHAGLAMDDAKSAVHFSVNHNSSEPVEVPIGKSILEIRQNMIADFEYTKLVTINTNFPDIDAGPRQGPGYNLD